ncbi:MAG: alpha,alpha-trehalose-phosphate synthase (UDP-forming) [Acidimicrobiales bacterium]
MNPDVEGVGGRWIIAANRGPVEFTTNDDGERVQHRGSGGLVTALGALAPTLSESVWICAPRTEEDRSVALESPGGLVVSDPGSGKQRVRLLALDPTSFEQYYSVIANPIIWFLQHNMWDLSSAPNITVEERAAFGGYKAVNEAFAEAVVEAIDEHPGGGTVMVQDYHLYLVGQMVRRARPGAKLMHFVHIPWPQPDAWRVLPGWMREELLTGLVGNDLVAFQTARDARNFLLTCEELLGLRVDYDDGTVSVDGRTVSVRYYPISIDAAQLESFARSDEVGSYVQALDNVRREHLIVRVDRTDLSKNVLRGFLAYERMLELHPDLAGRVTFLALLQPSRQDVPEYAQYTEKILRLVADINLKHGNVEWQPIDLRMEDNLAQAVAAYRLFDVLFVNPVYDGLNLVAKEGMLINERDGALVLSEHAGVHDEIGSYSVSVHPVDIEQQADALYEALFMEGADRRMRREACVEIIRRNGLAEWFMLQVRDIRALTQPAAEGTIPVVVEGRTSIHEAVPQG